MEEIGARGKAKTPNVTKRYYDNNARERSDVHLNDSKASTTAQGVHYPHTPDHNSSRQLGMFNKGTPGT